MNVMLPYLRWKSSVINSPKLFTFSASVFISRRFLTFSFLACRNKQKNEKIFQLSRVVFVFGESTKWDVSSQDISTPLSIHNVRLEVKSNIRAIFDWISSQNERERVRSKSYQQTLVKFHDVIKEFNRVSSQGPIKSEAFSFRRGAA